MMNFPKDKKALDMDTEYMFGHSFLVCPVTDSWNEKTLKGGQTIQREVPIDIMPINVRAGSIILWRPAVQYSTEKNWDNLEIRIYPSADASFTLHEDEYDNYNYEKGVYPTIAFHWNDATHTLSINDWEGEFPEMLKNRKFKIAVVSPKSGIGDQSSKNGKKVNYAGKKITIKL